MYIKQVHTPNKPEKRKKERVQKTAELSTRKMVIISPSSSWKELREAYLLQATKAVTEVVGQPEPFSTLKLSCGNLSAKMQQRWD